MGRFTEFERHLLPEAGRHAGLTVLEIGVGKGHYATWFLDNIAVLADAKYIGVVILPDDVDVFDDWVKGQSKGATRLRKRLSRYGNKATILYGIMDHSEGLRRKANHHIIHMNAPRDFAIYQAFSKDAWLLLAPSGLLIWSGYRDPKSQEVRQAVDEFLAEHEGEYEEVWTREKKCVRKLNKVALEDVQ